jgi:hypothetical protein
MEDRQDGESGAGKKKLDRRENRRRRAYPNGRNRTTQVDPDVPVMTVTGADGKLRAIAVGYACHATVLNIYQEVAAKGCEGFRAFLTQPCSRAQGRKNSIGEREKPVLRQARGDAIEKKTAVITARQIWRRTRCRRS